MPGRPANGESSSHGMTKWRLFIRSQDPYQHLITTSSDLTEPIWDDCDYYTHHDYPSDVITGLRDAPDISRFAAGQAGFRLRMRHERRPASRGGRSALGRPHERTVGQRGAVVVGQPGCGKMIIFISGPSAISSPCPGWATECFEQIRSGGDGRRERPAGICPGRRLGHGFTGYIHGRRHCARTGSDPRPVICRAFIIGP